MGFSKIKTCLAIIAVAALNFHQAAAKECLVVHADATVGPDYLYLYFLFSTDGVSTCQLTSQEKVGKGVYCESGEYYVDWHFNPECPEKGIDVRYHTPDANYTLIVGYETSEATTCGDHVELNCTHYHYLSSQFCPISVTPPGPTATSVAAYR